MDDSPGADAQKGKGEGAAAPEPVSADAAAPERESPDAAAPEPESPAVAALEQAIAEHSEGHDDGAGGDAKADRPLDPPKLVRLANLAREVLEEVRQMSPQDSTVQELADLYSRVEDQLKDALPESLAEELDAMDLDMPFRDGVSPEDVRIAYSGLIGWLGGLFQGLHASLLAAATPAAVMMPGREAGVPGMPPGAPPAPRPGLEPARRPTAEDRKGEGYL